jgi:hypothetical protein
MKLLIFSLLASFAFTAVHGQKYCETQNWNWSSDNTQENWTFRSADQGTIDWMGSIWTGPSRNVLSINRILVNEDYTSSNGWTLLYKDFGCDGALNNPYFILYNKYRGKMRLFMLLYKLNFGNGGIATLRWADPYKTTSLLTHSRGISLANDKYHTGVPINSDVITSTTDKISNSFYSDKWFVADFDIAFDHLTPVTESDYQLSIDVSAIQNSNVQMTGELDWITEPYSPNINASDIKPHSSDKTIKDYLTDAKSITKNIPSEGTLKKVFGEQKKELLKYQQSSEATLGNTKISQNYALTMTELEQGPSFINTLTSVGKYAPMVGQYIDVAIGVFDFFSGKSNTGPQQVQVTPTVTHGTVKLSGTITTERPIEPIIVGLPGTKQTFSAYKPYYNCPLGVIGLEKEPQLSMRKWSQNQLTYTSYSQKPGGEPNEKIVLFSKNFQKNMKSFRIDDDIKIAINANANVDVVDIRVAFCGKIRKNSAGKAAYKFTDPETEMIFYEYQHRDRIPNPYYYYFWTYPINDNFYSLTSMGEDGLAEFTTPLVDIQNLRGLSFTVREETDVYLKLYATLKAKDPNVASTPVVFIAKYYLTEPSEEDESVDGPYPYIDAQLPYVNIAEDSKNSTTLPSGTITQGSFENWNVSSKDPVLINAEESDVNIKAYHGVKLLPGVTIAPTNSSNSVYIKGVYNDSKRIPNNYTPIANLHKYYFADCNSGAGGRQASTNSFGELIEEAENSFEKSLEAVDVYPNSSSGIFNLTGLPRKQSEPSNVEVYDHLGKLIYSGKVSSSQSEVDITNHPNGLYTLKIRNRTHMKVTRVIKN